MRVRIEGRSHGPGQRQQDSSSFDSKLENAKAPLDDLKKNGGTDAINKLEAFIDEVETQIERSLSGERA